MTRRTTAGLASGTTLMIAGAAHAAGPSVTESLLRMPPLDAIGAAVGAVAAVQIYAWIKRRQERNAKKR